jgi:putative DNA primase/helicase
MNLTEELLASALPESTHHLLQYRVVTAEEAVELTGHKHAGWVVPMNGPDEKPYQWKDGKTFYRLKPATPVPTKDGKIAKYLTAGEAGCRPYLSPLLPKKALEPGKAIDWTEGEKKADCANHHGFATIGLSGVDSWRDKRNGRSQPLPEFDDLKLLKRTHRIAFDSDIVHKAEVRNAMAAFSIFLADKHAGRVLVTFIPPELDGGKNGIDDFIVRHDADAYDVLRQLARPATELDKEGNYVFEWSVEPKESHDKALIAWTVFKDNYAKRKGVGLYRWNGRHWQRCLDRTDSNALLTPLHLWMDHCGWVKRSTSAINSITSELLARLTADAPWDSAELIAFNNGTLNWKRGTFTAGHRREDFLTFCLPYDFDPDAKCPNFHRFLNEACGGDKGLINIVRGGFRWSISPKDTSQAFPNERAFDVTGRKGRGKGTLSEALQALVGGDHGRGLIKSTTFTNTNSLAGLIGKRVAMDPDSDGRISSAGTFNAVVSNEPVEVKLLYKDTHPQRLGVVVWRFFNDSPGASGGGVEGMGRRIITIPFDVEPGKRDPLLKQKIVLEAAGIFAWVFAMTTDEMTSALANSGNVASSAAASIEHALERDPVVRFLMESYPEGIDRIQARDLFKTWCSWCSEVRHESGSETRFGGLIKKVRVEGGVDAQGVRFWLSKGRRTYSLTPMQDFPLAAYFGVVAVDHHQNQDRHQDHHQSDEPGEQALEEKGDRGDSSSFKLNRLEKIYIKGINPPISTKETLCTSELTPPSPIHPADAFTDSSWAVSNNGFIEIPEAVPVYFSGLDGAHLIGKLPGPDRDRDLMVVRTPSGNIVGCSRDDYDL